MTQPAGRKIRLSLPRRFIGDLVHFAHQVPTVPMQRRMRLAPVVEARQAAALRPSWCAVFTKAYSMVSNIRPELRRVYMSFPWPFLYEHPLTIASVGVERQYEEEEAVFFAHLRSPQERSLAQIDEALRRFKEESIERVPLFRRILKLSRVPRPLRRCLWWLGLNLSGHRRARFLGTFGISVVAGLGAAGLHLLSPVTTALNYGVIGEDGTVDVRLTYDHRVLDGGTVARALDDLERILKGEILNELRYYRALDAA